MADEKSALLQSRIIKTEDIFWKKLIFLQDDNFKEWIDGGDQKLLKSLIKYQFVDPFKVWEHNGKWLCLDGKHRYLDLIKAEESGVEVPQSLPATFIDCANMTEAAELVLIYSSAYARITQQGFDDYIKKFSLELPSLKETLSLPDFEAFSLSFDKTEKKDNEVVLKSLQERFIVPPFSILDTRQGYWQDRKRLWHSLGFDSQETREDIELVARSGQAPAIYKLRNEMREKMGHDPSWDEILAEAEKKGMHVYKGASVFDPVLCEVLCSWFCPAGAVILDPFAGGSVRGLVAGILGYNYHGIDLRKEQVEANLLQWKRLIDCVKGTVAWDIGDSNELMDDYSSATYDFLFTCPPYHDLEQYSDDPKDLSNMDYDEFLLAYDSIIYKSVGKLKDNRFACFVVGEIRDKKGMYRNFVGDTIKAFLNAGMSYYNEIMLINVAGSVPIRVGRQFEGYRKVGKMHQNVLVFYKGDPKKIKQDFPKINVTEDLQLLNYQPNIALSVID